MGDAVERIGRVALPGVVGRRAGRGHVRPERPGPAIDRRVNIIRRNARRGRAAVGAGDRHGKDQAGLARGQRADLARGWCRIHQPRGRERVGGGVPSVLDAGRVHCQRVIAIASRQAGEPVDLIGRARYQGDRDGAGDQVRSAVVGECQRGIGEGGQVDRHAEGDVDGRTAELRGLGETAAIDVNATAAVTVSVSLGLVIPRRAALIAVVPVARSRPAPGCRPCWKSSQPMSSPTPRLPGL